VITNIETSREQLGITGWYFVAITDHQKLGMKAGRFKNTAAVPIVGTAAEARYRGIGAINHRRLGGLACGGRWGHGAEQASDRGHHMGQFSQLHLISLEPKVEIISRILVSSSYIINLLSKCAAKSIATSTSVSSISNSYLHSQQPLIRQSHSLTRLHAASLTLLSN